MWCRCTVALTVLVDVVVTGPVLPRRVGTGFVCTLHFCNFRILPDTDCCWWLVCFWLGFGLFTALFLAETFVESLILAQDERWRRA